MFRRIVKCSRCGNKPTMSKGLFNVEINCSCGFFGVRVEYQKKHQMLKAKRICIKHWNKRNKEYLK